MPTYFPSISDDVGEWAMSQPFFWTATAPRAGKHVNLSPKGYATFTVLGPNSAAYLDHTGSGAETLSHVYENGRITIAFMSTGKGPRILRFWCWGRVIEVGHKDFDALVLKIRASQKAYGRDPGIGGLEGVRAIVLLDVWKVGTSCGWGVPIFDGTFIERPTMQNFAHKMTEKGALTGYRARWNMQSLDGLTGLRTAWKEKGASLWLGNLVAWARMMMGLWDAVLVGVVIGIVMMWLAAEVQGMGNLSLLSL